MEEKKEPTLQERIDALKGQQEQAKEVFTKCAGAIEVLEGMLSEQAESDKED